MARGAARKNNLLFPLLPFLFLPRQSSEGVRLGHPEGIVRGLGIFLDVCLVHPRIRLPQIIKAHAVEPFGERPPKSGNDNR
jgi:hypothetical protein